MNRLIMLVAMLASIGTAEAQVNQHDSLSFQECRILHGVWSDKAKGAINFKYFIRTSDRIYAIPLHEARRYVNTDLEQHYFKYIFATQSERPDPCKHVYIDDLLNGDEENK